MLIDREIREAIASGELVVEPSASVDTRIQPASLDVCLGHTFATYNRRLADVIDVKTDTREFLEFTEVADGEFFTVHPGELVLAHTLEHVGLDSTLLARVEGKSSLGRLGLFVHSTAGFIDPGWPLASITLEISTVIGIPIRLYPGMPIAQLAIERVLAASVPYAGKYVGQAGPTPSRYFQNWTGSRWA